MNPKNSLIPNPDIIELTIESLSYFGGRGVGRHEGIVVFVPETAPQDRIRARVTANKGRFWEAELVEILRPSPYRRTPPCPVADRCGGCSWQHIVYSEQVAQKEKILHDSLRRILKLQEFEWLPFIPAPAEFNYRNRIQVHFKNGEKGFFAKRSRQLVPVEICAIAEEELNRRLSEVGPQEYPSGSRIEFALTETGDAEAALFAQVNTAQNKFLKRRIPELAVKSPDWIFDLYCGSGNFTLPLAERFNSVSIVAIELSRTAIDRARELSAGFKNIEWIAQDTGKALAKISVRGGVGLAVLDPPRAGCDADVIKQLIRHAPSHLLYVSCNPTTFARDAERLIQGGGYRLSAVQGVDMFPQTEHVELIGVFELPSSV